MLTPIQMNITLFSDNGRPISKVAGEFKHCTTCKFTFQNRELLNQLFGRIYREFTRLTIKQAGINDFHPLLIHITNEFTTLTENLFALRELDDKQYKMLYSSFIEEYESIKKINDNNTKRRNLESINTPNESTKKQKPFRNAKKSKKAKKPSKIAVAIVNQKVPKPETPKGNSGLLGAPKYIDFDDSERILSKSGAKCLYPECSKKALANRQYCWSHYKHEKYTSK